MIGGLAGWWTTGFKTWNDPGHTLVRNTPTLVFILLLWRHGKPYQAARRSAWTAGGQLNYLVTSLLLGVPAILGALVTGASPTRAVLVGVGLGASTVVAGLYTTWRRSRTAQADEDPAAPV